MSDQIEDDGDEPPLPEALFTPIDSTGFLPSAFTRGPWRADAQHGGPPAALLVAVVERQVQENEFLSHLEIELVRPVPLERLDVTDGRDTVSRRVARVRGELHAAGKLVARASGLSIQRSEVPTPEWRPEDVPAVEPPPPEARVDPPRWASGQGTTYHRNAVEHRFTAGSFREPGPAVDWQRLRLPIVVGAEPSGLQRLAAAADFGSGISAVFGPESKFGLINANLSISLARSPVGEWISLDAVTHVGPQGTGLGITTLGDRTGPVGIATQSLLGYAM